jgi:hypothetical protein
MKADNDHSRQHRHAQRHVRSRHLLAGDRLFLGADSDGNSAAPRQPGSVYFIKQPVGGNVDVVASEMQT